MINLMERHDRQTDAIREGLPLQHGATFVYDSPFPSAVSRIEQGDDVLSYDYDTRGRVSRVHGVFDGNERDLQLGYHANSQLAEVVWCCVACGHALVPMVVKGPREVRPTICPQCQKHGPFRVHATKTLYRNHQTCTVQEPPGDMN